MTAKRKKRIVEIYFILYLAALLFLLPDSKREIQQGIGTGIQVFQPSFVLLPEKNTLICRVVLEEDGPKIYSHDSINTIFYTGDVEDVKFDFIIEDQTLKNAVSISSHSNPTSKFFQYEDRSEQNAAVFKWYPPLQELSSRTFVVRVKATANVKNAQSETDSTLKSKIVTYSTQFTLLLVYLNAPGGNPLFAQNFFRPQQTDTSMQFTIPFQSLLPQIPTGTMNYTIRNQEIRQIAGQRWLNTLTVTNVNLLKDLTSEQVKIDYTPKNTGGRAEIFSIKDDEIIVQGITPTFGKMKVTLSFQRKYDTDQKDITFNVTPVAFESPNYERYMYPEITYEFEPNLPDIGKNVYAVITDGKTIRAKSQKGEKFKFTPTPMDIDNVFYLERYIDNDLIGEKNVIRVLQYPEPVIVDIQQISNDEVEVITRSHGISNKTRNEVESFIVEGNASYRDLRGKLVEKREKSFPVTIQYFRFKAESGDKPFNFRIVAVDMIGNKSIPKIYR